MSLLMVPRVRPWSGLSRRAGLGRLLRLSLGRWASGWLGLAATCTRVCAGALHVPQLTLPMWRLGSHSKPWLHSAMTSFLLRSIGQGTSRARPDGWMRGSPGKAASPGAGWSRESELVIASLPATHSYCGQCWGAARGGLLSHWLTCRGSSIGHTGDGSASLPSPS